MPSERRNLRSNKDSTSSTNGEKARADSQSSASNKDKPVPARTTSSKGKGIPAKKGGPNTAAKDMSGNQHKTNGTEPAENGVNGAEDIEMADEVTDNPKTSASKDESDEMTVVVPAPKSSKLVGDPPKDNEGDVAMENTEGTGPDHKVAVAADPKSKAIAGKSPTRSWIENLYSTHWPTLTFSYDRYQGKFRTSRKSCGSI